MRALIALVLLGGCHCRSSDEAGSTIAVLPASTVSDGVELPKLPQSPDGIEELKQLDQSIEIHRGKFRDTPFLLSNVRERATVYGHVEDYLDALAITKAWIETTPNDEAAWSGRIGALLAVHRFAEARALFPHIEASSREGLQASVDEATGKLDEARAYKEKLLKIWPTPTNAGQLAASLALVGRYDEALAMMKQAESLVRDNPPTLFAWLLFQWGRIYELKGELAAARKFYVASRARLVTLEATVHLIQTMQQTGDPAGALALARAEATVNPHPELLALAGRIDEARAGWERYLAVLPEAFSDHAARFFLAAGNDPARALTLARANLANRATPEAYALVVEAALAAGKPADACTAADPIATNPATTRPNRFLVWKAYSACGRKADADRLGGELGISGSAAPRQP